MTAISMSDKPAAECYSNGGLCFYPEYNHLVRLDVIAACHIAYFVVIFGLKMFMKGRPAMELSLPMKFYNLLQVALSGSMTIGLAPYLLSSGTLFNLNGSFTATIEFWVLLHYVTKYLDMFDTVWMVLRHKTGQMTFLHLYHHMTIGAIWGVLLHYGIGNGTAYFGAWINSLVHTLMYSHYFITSIGLENPLKKYLTQFQIFQFGLCFLHALLVAAFETEYPTEWSYLQLSYHCTLIVLFVNFYRTTIAAAKKKKISAEKKSL